MVELDPKNMPLQHLYSLYTEGKLRVNRKYQRKLVWDLRDKQELIESIFSRYPIPAVLLAAKDDHYEIIDGLQRLHTLMSFIDSEFPTADGKFFAVEEFPAAMKRHKVRLEEDGKEVAIPRQHTGKPLISADDVVNYLGYTLMTLVMRDGDDSQVDDVFRRINTYGRQLSDQERRQAGVLSLFSQTVRTISREVRGDDSTDVLDLPDMPAISVDGHQNANGYSIRASEVYWVRHGAISSSELRQGMDEQLVADIVGSILTEEMLDRSRQTLDQIYQSQSTERANMDEKLRGYGAERLRNEIKHTLDIMDSVCRSPRQEKLRNLLGVRTSNFISNAFSVVVVAFHRCLYRDKLIVKDPAAIRKSLSGAYRKMETGNRSTSSSNIRERNVEIIQKIIKDGMSAHAEDFSHNHLSVFDVENIVRRAQIEGPRHELKQGILALTQDIKIQESMITKVVKTICAIANCANPDRGAVVIGVCDTLKDSERVKHIYPDLKPIEIDKHCVIVGTNREAERLGENTQEYLKRWKDAIRNSQLSNTLKQDVLSSIDYHPYHGLGVLVLWVPPQNSTSYVGTDIYERQGDETVLVPPGPGVESVILRFQRKQRSTVSSV